MASFLPFVALALLYLFLFITTFDSESAAAFSNPQLGEIARLFGDEKVTLTGWVHFIVADLFVGRWIYWEGQQTGVWTIHSLVLCLFAGPLGLLSHLITRWISQGVAARLTSASTSVSTSASTSEISAEGSNATTSDSTPLAD